MLGKKFYVVCDFITNMRECIILIVLMSDYISLWFPVHRYLAWALDTNLEERAKVT